MNKLTDLTTPPILNKPFSSLRTGDRFTHNINVHTVFKRDESSITVKRADGWFVTVNIGDWGWDKMIKKI